MRELQNNPLEIQKGNYFFFAFETVVTKCTWQKQKIKKIVDKLSMSMVGSLSLSLSQTHTHTFSLRLQVCLHSYCSVL